MSHFIAISILPGALSRMFFPRKVTQTTTALQLTYVKQTLTENVFKLLVPINLPQKFACAEELSFFTLDI